MKRETWRETRCKQCIFLVTADNEIFHCSKLRVLPVEFEPVYTEKARINRNCPGFKDLPGVEASIQKSYDTIDNLKVI
jgi:hypothetical protein